MNIIKERQLKRAHQIGQIEEGIKKAKEAGKEIDPKRLLIATMATQNLSKRTSQEYIEIAFFNLEDAK